MTAFERRRNEATMADYKQNLHLAQFKPPPADLIQLRRALRGNQEETNQFYLANEGMIPKDAFFNPANMGRIMSRYSNGGGGVAG